MSIFKRERQKRLSRFEQGFPDVPHSFYNAGMLDSSPSFAVADLSAAILSAPGWARVGLTAPSPRLREAAATELARTILGKDAEPDRDQLRLAL